MNEKLIQIGASVEFDCKSQHPKCKAGCCGTIDFVKELWEKNQHKVVRKPVRIVPSPKGTHVMPVTDSGYCPFLKEDYHCNIYDERPDVCKEYGTESSVEMSCPYLKKDGIQRSRQERRSIQRKVDKMLKDVQEKFNKLYVD